MNPQCVAIAYASSLHDFITVSHHIDPQMRRNALSPRPLIFHLDKLIYIL